MKKGGSWSEQEKHRGRDRMPKNRGRLAEPKAYGMRGRASSKPSGLPAVLLWYDKRPSNQHHDHDQRNQNLGSFHGVGLGLAVEEVLTPSTAERGGGGSKGGDKDKDGPVASRGHFRLSLEPAPSAEKDGRKPHVVSGGWVLVFWLCCSSLCCCRCHEQELRPPRKVEGVEGAWLWCCRW